MDNDLKLSNNNNFYCSTPHKAINGNISDISMNDTNGYYIPSKVDDSSLKNYTNEQLMNSRNTNTSKNGTNTSTIIAEIEGEIKKKHRHYLDETYYIAKEILMTELTYKKDLDVINVVIYFLFIKCDYILAVTFCHLIHGNFTFVNFDAFNCVQLPCVAYLVFSGLWSI